MDAEAREKFDTMLTAPLPLPRAERRRRAAVSTEVPNDEADGFMGFMAEHQTILATTTTKAT